MYPGVPVEEVPEVAMVPIMTGWVRMGTRGEVEEAAAAHPEGICQMEE